MKKLLCLISNMNAGGAETFLMKIYRKLDRTKYQMDFCVNIREKGFYDDEILSLGGKIFYVPPKTKDYKRFRSGLKKLIQQEKYEYVLGLVKAKYPKLSDEYLKALIEGSVYSVSEQVKLIN